MLDMDMFETGVRRIGAEQEMFLVDQASRPAPIAMEVLDAIDDGHLQIHGVCRGRKRLVISHVDMVVDGPPCGRAIHGTRV